MKTQATLSAIVAAAAYSLMLVPDAFAGVTLVPEPGTFLVLGAGAAVVAVGAWWRNRK
jgi:hypothetical protein